MSASLFQLLHTLFGAHLGIWVAQVHAVVVSLLALAWFWPLLAAMFRRLPKSAPDIEWIQLWRCPECSTYNRRTFNVCTHCEYHLKVGGLARWVPMKFSEFIKHNALRLLRLYQLVGWVVFYGLTGLVFWKLKLFVFQQNAIQELMASAVMALLLGALMFFRKAFQPRLKSPISGLLDTVAGGVTTGLLLVFLFLWAQAAAQKDLSARLISIYSFSIGRLQVLQSKPFSAAAPTSLASKISGTLRKAARPQP